MDAANTAYSNAMAGHSADHQAALDAAQAAYDSAVSGLQGAYDSAESTAAAARDSVLSAHSGTTYDPSVIDDATLQSLVDSATAGLQPGLDAAADQFDGDVQVAVDAYDAAMNGPGGVWDTYNSAVAAATATRDAAVQAAEDAYSQAAAAAGDDYAAAVAAIEADYDTALAAAQAAYDAAMAPANDAYNAAVATADAQHAADVQAAQDELSDWLANGPSDPSGGSGGGSGSGGTFHTRTKTVDYTTDPPTTTVTGTIPSGAFLQSTTVTREDGVVTTVETWFKPDGSGGLSPGGGGSSSDPGASGNPWENAKTARLEGLTLELEAYQQQYDATMADASVVLDAAVQAATENYYVTLYGTTDGSGPFGAGTPAEAFSNALEGAYQAFDTAEQAAFQTYIASMDTWNAAMMQFYMDEMMGIPSTPPDPNDPARYSKDYHVDVAALNVNFAATVGAAWVSWVTAEVAADTTREQDIINAEYGYGVTQAVAGLQFSQQAITAEDSAAKDIIDIDADFAIARVAKEGEAADAIADADLTHAQALNAAAETLALADNNASKDQADSIVAADETRANGIAAEETDLTKDLAAADETRQNDIASAEADLVRDEAAAGVTATAMAGSAATALAGGVMGAYVGYVGTVTGLISSAQQGLNGDIHNEYVTATGSDPDQAAVSQGWTDYLNALAGAEAAFAVGEAGAAASIVNSAAAADEDLANDAAAEAETLTNANAGAYTAWVSTVAAAATNATNDLADAGLALSQSINSAVAAFLNSTTAAGKTLADTGVTEAVSLADSVAGAVNAFSHSYIGSAVSYDQDVIEEGRTADKDADSALSTLASGVASEQHDLSIDGLNEGKLAASAFSVLDDGVIIAQAVLDAASGVLSACYSLAEYVAAPLSTFAGSMPTNGSAPMATVAMAPSPAASEPGVLASIGNWFSYKYNTWAAVVTNPLAALGGVRDGVVDGLAMVAQIHI